MRSILKRQKDLKLDVDKPENSSDSSIKAHSIEPTNPHVPPVVSTSASASVSERSSDAADSDILAEDWLIARGDDDGFKELSQFLQGKLEVLD